MPRQRLPGGYRHAREGRVDRRIVAWMTPPSILGAVVGALLTDELPTKLLLVAIAAILAWNGVDLLVRPSVRESAGRG